MKKKIFLDMDGTLAMFYEHADCLERMFDKGFIFGLNPYKNLISAIENISDKIDIYIVSAVNQYKFDQTIDEKRRWLKKYCPFISEENYIFTLFGENKTEAVIKKIGYINEDVYLIDDYNENLHDWINAGGSTIKFVNEINDKGTKGPLWDGARLYWNSDVNETTSQLIAIVGDDKTKSIKLTDYVFCTACKNIKYDDEQIPYCAFENECDIWDSKDGRRFAERPKYQPV